MNAPETQAEEQPSLAGAAQQNRMLAASLAEPLKQACGGCLGNISWFRTDWQRGGAATGYSTWRGPRQAWPDDARAKPAASPHDGRPKRAPGDTAHDVVVKLPVNARELTWLRRLQCTDRLPPVPILYAGGEGLNGYDMAWIVIERLPHGPLGSHWEDGHVTRIAAAIAEFYALARRTPVDRAPRKEAWDQLVHAARESVKTNGVAERQRWTEALKSLAHRLDSVTAIWESRGPIEWLHGDLHMANAMCREPGDDAPVCLLDLAEVRPGHWVEDAVYLERQMWGFPERLRATKPVKAIGDARRRVGLDGGPDDARLATIRRVLLAGTAPAFMRSEGHPAYLRACLERLEQLLPQVR